MKKNTLIRTGIKILIPVVILIIIILVKFRNTESDEFSLAKYVTLSITGLNSRASAKAELDKVGLYNVLAGSKASDEEKAKYDDFVNSVTFTLSDDSNLSNGDVVTIDTTYDEKKASDMKIKVDKTSRKYKVSNLKKGKALDAFEDIQIITSGTSPYIYVTYANNSSNDYLQSLEYSISKSNKLAIGDEIEITCISDEESAANNGYYIESTVMKYTISKADEYITKGSDMDMSIISNLHKDNIQVIVDETKDTTSHMSYKITNDNSYLFMDNHEEAKNFEYYKTELGTNTTGSEQKHENYVLVYYKGQIELPTYTDDSPYKYIDAYFCFIYYDAVKKTDGTVSMTTNEPKLRYVCGNSYETAFYTAQSEIGIGYEYSDIDK